MTFLRCLAGKNFLKDLKLPSIAAKLTSSGNAYLVLDGGTGTLVELFVVWEMSNKKFLNKPVIVLGQMLSGLVERIRKFPHVTDPPSLFLTDSIQNVLKRLKK